MKKSCFIFAAGGSGGHIFPALAIARSLKKELPDSNIIFIGTRRGLETKIIPENNFPLHYLSVGQLNKNAGLTRRFITLLLLPVAFMQSILILFRYRPRAVVGVGGYATGPMLLMASLLGFKSYLWEPNAYPGMANRILSSYVRMGFISFTETLKHLKLKRNKIVGYPLREQLDDPPLRQSHTLNEFRIFVFGGSQGSRGINTAVFEMIKHPDFDFKSIKLVHQIGATDFKMMSQKYSELTAERRECVEFYEFIKDMPKYYQWADVAICRAGMGTIAELQAMSVPAILIPLPTAADNHQEMNARELLKEQACRMILQKDLNANSLWKEIFELISDRKAVDQMAENVHKFYKPRAAAEIANTIFKDLGS